MKNLLTAIIMVVSTLGLSAQSWNPYLNQGIIGPGPLVPEEFNGSGQISLRIGNTGGDVLPLVVGDELHIEIRLHNIEPNNPDPVLAIGGTWAHFFNWNWEPSLSAYHGVQNQDLPDTDVGSVIVDIRVSNNTHLMNANNGFEAELLPPAHLAGKNHPMDDLVSSYTFVRAWDYSDAAAPYPVAWHEINITRQTGQYLRYVMLGNVVDHEDGVISGPNGLADDLDGIDDEDGVIMPPLFLGANVQIPVTVTVYDNSYGFLNAWIDWNGDGDFNDPGEKLTPTAILVNSSGTYNIPVTVPVTAVTTQPVIARFRIGANLGPAGANPWGEVEDYEVLINVPQVNVVASMNQSNGPVPVTNPGQILEYEISLSNVGLIPVSNITATKVFPGSGAGFLSAPAESMISDLILQPGETWSYSANYIITQSDINNFSLIENGVSFNSSELPSSSLVTVITPIQRIPSIEIDILATPNAGLKPGDMVILTHVVTNTGNVTLGNVGVATNHDGTGLMGAVLPSFTSAIDPGASVSYSASYEVSPGDVIAQLPVQFSTLVHGLFDGLGYTDPDNVLITMKSGYHDVNMISLEATLVMDIVELDWSTRFEINNPVFEILRRHEKDFQYIHVGSVTGAGSAVSPNHYFYLDNVVGLPAGKVFYKLQVSDQIAEVYIQHSAGITESGNGTGFSLNIYPLPPTDVINVTLFGPKQSMAEVRLFNAAGQLLDMRKEMVNSQFRIDVSTLPAGVYFINAMTGDDVITEKFVKP